MIPTDNYCPYDITSDPAEFGLVSEFINCKFGKLFIVRSEQRNNVATLFLHGVGDTWSSWTPLLQAARNTVELGDVILVDLPGFGRSENTLGHLRASVVGAELLSIIEALGWNEVNLVGHSMGGFLALDIAANGHPVIKSVSVISGTYLSIIESVQHPFKTLFRQPGTSLVYSSMILLAKLGSFARWLLQHSSRSKLFLKVLANSFAHPEQLKRSVVDGLVSNIRPKAFTLAAQNGRQYEPELEWGKITVPFKALFGATDRLVPIADMRRLDGSLNNIQTHCVADAGHFAHVERPKETLNWLYGK